MKTLAKALLALIVLTICGLSLFGCETVQGVGRDVENLGETIQGD